MEHVHLCLYIYYDSMPRVGEECGPSEGSPAGVAGERDGAAWLDFPPKVRRQGHASLRIWLMRWKV